MAARQLLFEERFGVHIRAAEREERIREQGFADQYAATRKYLQRQSIDQE